jgi:hypothetical protein
MCVDVVVEDSGSAEEGWTGLTLPENEALSDADVFALVQALVPAGATPIYCDHFRDRKRRRGEIVYRWEHYEGNNFWGFEGSDLIAKGLNIQGMLIGGTGTGLDAYGLIIKELEEQDC